MTKALKQKEKKAKYSFFELFSIREGRLTLLEITYVRLKPSCKKHVSSFGLISFSNRGKGKPPVSFRKFYKRETNKTERRKFSVIRRALRTLAPGT